MLAVDPAGNKAPTGGFSQGGWYSGYQFYNGSFAPQAGQIHPQSTQQGAGQAVSPQVNAQTSVAAGLAPNANQDYVDRLNAKPPAPTSGGQPAGGVPGGAPSGGTSGGASGAGVGVPASNPAQPTFDLVAATNAAYNTPEIQAATKAITDRQTALATATAGINDNPFYSEATRVGKLAKLTDQANNDIKVQQDILTGLRADAQIKVNAAQGQYNINEKTYQDSLSNFDRLVSMGALDNANGQDIANLSVQTGIPTSMIQSIISANQKKNAPKVSIVQATDNQGNLTILGVDSNGQVVQQTTIPGAGKEATYKGQPIGDTGTPSGGGTGATTPKESNTDNLITSVKNYNNLKDIVQAFAGVLPIATIYQLYNTYSPFGPAQNTLAEVKAGTITK